MLLFQTSLCWGTVVHSVVGVHIVESWLKEITSDGIISLQCNWVCLGVVLEGVENCLVIVVMCEQSCSVLLNEATKNYEIEIAEGKSLWLTIRLLFLSALV